MVPEHWGTLLSILLAGKPGHSDCKQWPYQMLSVVCSVWYAQSVSCFVSPRRPADEYFREEDGPLLLPESLDRLMRIHYALAGCQFPENNQQWERFQVLLKLIMYRSSMNCEKKTFLSWKESENTIHLYSVTMSLFWRHDLVQFCNTGPLWLSLPWH